MNAKQLFQKYHKRMVAEGILKATLIGLLAALAVLFVTAAVCWFVGFKGIWLSIVLFVVVLAATAVTVYLVKYRPTTRSIARRVDELGLEERLITMTELEGDDSYIATRQRQDAMESLNKVSALKSPFRLRSLRALRLPAFARQAPPRCTLCTTQASSKAASSSSIPNKLKKPRVSKWNTLPVKTAP